VSAGQRDGRQALRDVYRRLLRHYGPQSWWPGETPFEVMVGAVLTQNTSWENVERAIANLRDNAALDPEVIVTTHPKRLASWLRPSGYFNVKTKRLRNFCRWYLAEGGLESLREWPTAPLRRALLGVSGVGPETADDILLYAFGRPVFVIDAYTRRIFARLGTVEGGEDYEVLRALFEERLGRGRRNVAIFNEYHALIVRHAKQACRVRPLCEQCCLAAVCPSAGLEG